MSPKVKIILFLLIIFNIKSFVLGRCSIELNQDPALRPKILLTLGSRLIDVNVDKEDSFFRFFENQKIILECNTKFSYPPYMNDRNIIELTCSSSSGICITDGSCYGDTSYDCAPQKWNLYESLQNFSWCSKNTSSYIIARPTDLETKRYQYLAGVCYDTYNLSFKSLYYTISSKGLHLVPADLNGFYTPNLELKHINETLKTKTVAETDYSHPDIQNWVQFAKYNYSSIVQNNLDLIEFDDEFGSLLDLIWWPNLRLGNWKRYQNALQRELESAEKSFDIIAGVSAVATAPIIAPCATNFTLTPLVDNTNNKVPLYIWNYLRAKSNSSDEIVIIGVNSPFYEFYSESDIVFCQDKCKDVPWLRDTRSTFRYSAVGIMFCCSSEDVKLSQRLDGFPDFNVNSHLAAADTTTIHPIWPMDKYPDKYLAL